MQSLLALDLLHEISGSQSTGGRPPATLTFNQSAGAVLVADLDGTHCRLAISDLAAVPMGGQAFAFDPAVGPEPVLDAVCARLGRLLDARGGGLGPLRGVALAIDGALAASWDGFSITDWVARSSRYADVPVLLDSHVNAMALGEHWAHWRDVDHLLLVNVGTRIECGIVSGGAVHRGANGVAGDLGHVAVAGYEDVPCTCGNSGCLEAIAGGPAVVAAAAAEGLEVDAVADVVAAALADEPRATRVVRRAGRALGEVLAACVSFFNPGAIVLSGELTDAPLPLLAGVRETTLTRSLPMATRDLRIGISQLGARAAIIGAAVLVVENVLAPESIDAAAQRATALR